MKSLNQSSSEGMFYSRNLKANFQSIKLQTEFQKNIRTHNYFTKPPTIPAQPKKSNYDEYYS